MTFNKFVPKYWIRTDDGELLHVMLSRSTKSNDTAVFSVMVEPHTNRYLGKVVESRVRVGYYGSPCFHRNRKRYYLSWLRPLTKQVDKK